MAKERALENGQLVFSGNIYIFYAFDIGDDIEFEKIKKDQLATIVPLDLPRYFKGYHIPLGIELPHPHTSSRNISTTLHSFGALSFTYEVPFNSTLEELKKNIESIYNEYQEQSVSDAGLVFKRIKPAIKQPHFFNLRTAYLVIQLDRHPMMDDSKKFKEKYDTSIASLLRFETEALSEEHKQDIMQNVMGYYKKDLVIINADTAFVCDDEYKEFLPLFEFANLQLMALQYFDQTLDKELNEIYEQKKKPTPLIMYLPFFGTWAGDAVSELGKLRVDISVISERIASTVHGAGEAYITDLFEMITQELDIKHWHHSVEHKLDIIKDVRTIYQHKVDSLREDFTNVLISFLIFVELIIALLEYIK